jgi:hypothetical protein
VPIQRFRLLPFISHRRSRSEEARHWNLLTNWRAEHLVYPSDATHKPPSPWKEFLSELDEALSEPIELYCIGGFVISMLYGLMRPTADVDCMLPCRDIA